MTSTLDTTQNAESNLRKAYRSNPHLGHSTKLDVSSKPLVVVDSQVPYCRIWNRVHLVTAVDLAFCAGHRRRYLLFRCSNIANKDAELEKSLARLISINLRIQMPHQKLLKESARTWRRLAKPGIRHGPGIWWLTAGNSAALMIRKFHSIGSCHYWYHTTLPGKLPGIERPKTEEENTRPSSDIDSCQPQPLFVSHFDSCRRSASPSILPNFTCQNFLAKERSPIEKTKIKSTMPQKPIEALHRPDLISCASGRTARVRIDEN